MLSKKDIERQIGKGINIVPFKRENIKENSINFTISNMAWTICHSKSKAGYNKAKSACHGGKLVLEPHSTTVVYTTEVVALNNKLGGTFHAKVGIVSKGVIFCSTMIGPSYCGHLMISLQNPTDDKIELKIGDTFISLILFKLDTKVNKTLTNSNTGGHTDKLASLGIVPTDIEKKNLDEDWKKNVATIQQKLYKEESYKTLKNEFSKKKTKFIVALLVLFLIVSGIAYFGIKFFIVKEDLISIISSVSLAIIVELIAVLTGAVKNLLKIDL